MTEIYFSITEWILLLSWLFALSITLKWLINKRNPIAIFSPPSLLIVLNLYYCLYGPIVNILTDQTLYKGVDLREYLDQTWFAALLCFSITILFYRFSKPHPRAPVVNYELSDSFLSNVGNAVNTISLVLFFIYAGSSLISFLRPFKTSSDIYNVTTFYSGLFSNYLAFSVNLLSVGTLLLWITFLKGKKTKKQIYQLAIWLTLTILVYISLGFRYRIAILLGGLYVAYHLVLRKRINIFFSFICILLLLISSSLFVMGRSYNRGIILDNVNFDTYSILVNTAQESSVFWTSAGILKVVPEKTPFVGFTPIVNSLLHPIPKALFPNKNSDGYLIDPLIYIYGSKLMATGAAFTSWAEWYLMGGWFGLIVGSAVYGWLYRWLWQWFQQRQTDLCAIAYYAGAWSYQYMIFSRGYMPQQLFLFTLGVLPLWFLYRFSNKRAYRLNKKGKDKSFSKHWTAMR
jgi:hypothetical protein